MPNNYLSVLYKHIIQVENKNVGLKVGGHKHTIAPPIKKVGGHMPPLPPRFLRQCRYVLWVFSVADLVVVAGLERSFYLTTHSAHFIYG